MASVLTFRCNEVMKLIDPSFEPKKGYLPPGCCWSCHEDEDVGYPLMNPDINGQEAEICCAIYRLAEASSLNLT